MEDFAKQQQLAMMTAAHVQFVSCISSTPSPTKMPLEVRKYMWDQLGKTRKLFAPQNEEEQAFYADVQQQ